MKSRASKLNPPGCLIPLKSCQSNTIFSQLSWCSRTYKFVITSNPWRGWGRAKKSISSTTAFLASWVLCYPAGAEGGGGVKSCHSRWPIKGPPRPKFETPGDSESHFPAIEMTASLFLHTGGRLLLSLVGNLPWGSLCSPQLYSPQPSSSQVVSTVLLAR